MIFDANILNVICVHIHDPKTFMHFALTCSKTKYVTDLRKKDKMKEFSIRKTYNDTDMYGDGIHIVDENYYRASGTSMACPHVAGLAGLLLSIVPEISNEQVGDRLRTTADNIDELADKVKELKELLDE